MVARTQHLTIAPNLKAAIESGDRAEAWYEIRYNSNGGTVESEKPGIANRRYAESEVFKLFNNENNVSLEEARDALEMYTSHKTKILNSLLSG